MAVRLAHLPLQDAFVRLEPFGPAVREAVRAAVDVDPDSWALSASCAQGERFDGWWAQAERRGATGAQLGYAIVRRSDGRTVGVSSLLDPSAEHARVEIGASFLHPDARGGAVNPAAKRLMLDHAFAAGARRVELVTDARNLRSQAAIAALGAVQEGVLRRHKTTWTGFVRDTVVFAVTDHDWPAVRARLDARLAAHLREQASPP